MSSGNRAVVYCRKLNLRGSMPDLVCDSGDALQLVRLVMAPGADPWA